MKLQIVGRHMAVTVALRQHVEQRLSRLARFLDGQERVHIVLGMERFLQTAEGLISTRRGAVKARAATNDMYASIDALAHKLELQVRKKKERFEIRKAPRPVESARQRLQPPDEREATEKIRVAVPTLAYARAAEAFRNSADALLVFRDAPSRKIMILCRGEREGIRLIEPDLDRFF
jgi:putative sigma-54 modulation protein